MTYETKEAIKDWIKSKWNKVVCRKDISISNERTIFNAPTTQVKHYASPHIIPTTLQTTASPNNIYTTPTNTTT